MQETEYLETFVNDQISWYDRKSIWSQKRYKTLRTTVIVISILIPVLASTITSERLWLKFVTGGAGALVAILESLIALNKYKDNWIEYRATCEALKREKRFYLTQSGVYQDATKAFSLFVEQVESITAQENLKWVRHTAKKETKQE